MGKKEIKKKYDLIGVTTKKNTYYFVCLPIEKPNKS